MKRWVIFVLIFKIALSPVLPVFAQEASQSAQLLQQAVLIPQVSLPFQGQFPISQKFGEEVKDPTILQKLVDKFGGEAAVHNGIDFEIPEGMEMLAVDDGEVVKAGDGDFGEQVVIKHAWGESVYGHLKKIQKSKFKNQNGEEQERELQKGDIIPKGQIIGLSGSSGIVTGPHLHLGIKNSRGEWVDPVPYLGISNPTIAQPPLEATNSAQLLPPIEATASANLQAQVLGEATPSASLTVPKLENIATDSAYLFNYKFNLINGNSAHFDSKDDNRPGFAIADENYDYKLRFFLKEATNSAQPKVESNQIEFPVIVHGIPLTLRYTVTEDRVKEEFIISEKPQGTEDVKINFEVQNVGLSFVEQNGEYIFSATDSAQIYWKILKPTMADASGKSGEILGKFESASGIYSLTILADYLQQASYPVVIDPTVMFSDQWQEVASQRTQRSKTYQDTTNPNKYSLDAVLTPLHYESVLDSGNYNTQINMTPVRVNNAQLDGWRVTQAGWHYALGKPGDKTTDGWVGFGGRQGENWFKFRLAKTGYLHWPTRAWQDIGGAPTYNRTNLSSQINSLTLGPNNDQIPAETAATWSNLWTTPGGGQLSASWRANGEQLKEEITLNQAGRNWIAANRPPTTPLSETYFGFVFQLDWSDIPKVIRAGIEQNIESDFADDNENIEFKDSLDRLLAFMPLDNVKVPNADPALEETQPLRKRFWKDASGNYYLLIGLRTDTLNSMSAGDLVFDPTIDVQVGTNEDDVFHRGGDHSIFSNTNNFGVGNNGSSGTYTLFDSAARFTNVTIAQGSTIDVAYLTLQANSTLSGTTVNTNIQAEDVDDATNITTDADWHNRVLTTALTAWDNIAAWTIEDIVNSPSIVSVIKEVIDRAGWASGNDINIFWLNDGSTLASSIFRNAYSYNHSATKAPKLHIEYTEGGNTAPSAPSSLGPASLVDGSFGSDNTPTPTFTLSDSDGADTVKFQIQIDDTSDFSSAVVDYTSALAAQGSTSFTVGQAAGSGTYTTGSSGQTLADGSYYWRVLATDNGGLSSSYSTANSGAIAFKVDTTAPTNQDTVFAASASKTGGAAVTVVSSGDATNAIWFAPSGTTSFAAGATMTTAGGTATSILAPSTAGDYKLFVLDAAGNASSASTATLTVDNTAPTAAITYSDADGIVKSGDSLTITATFNEAMADSPVVKIAITGSNTVAATVMTKTDTTHYTYSHTVGAGNGAATVAMSVGTDAAGNVITAAPTSGATFTVDNTAPSTASSLASSSHTASTWSTDTTVDVSWTAATDTGGSGVAGYSFIFDTAATTTPDTTSDDTITSTTSAAQSDGNSIYFHVRAVDNVGNWGTAVHLGPFYVDATAPAAPGTPSVVTTPTTDTTPSWSWTASSDSGSGLASSAYTVSWCTNTSYTGCSSNTTTSTTNSFTHSTALADGTWYFRVKATDAVGNESSYSSNGSVVVDITSPDSVDLQSPAHDSYTNNSRPTFKWKAASGLSKYKFEINNGTGGDISIDSIATSGTKDVDSNRYYLSYENFSDSDSDNNYISIYTKSSSDWSLGENDGKLREGKRTWQVIAYDTAGNTKAGSRTLYADFTAPNLSDVKVKNLGDKQGYLVITDFAISGKTTDTLAPDKIEVSFYRENYFLGILLSTSLSTTFTHSLANTNNNTSLDFNFIPTVDYGKYNIKIVSLDKAGNKSNVSEFNKIQYLSEASAKRLFAQDKEKLDELKDKSQISLYGLEKKAKFRREKEAGQLKEVLNDLGKQFGATLNFFSGVSGGTGNNITQAYQAASKTAVLIYQDASIAVSQTLDNVSSGLIALNLNTGRSLTESQITVGDRIVQARKETAAEFVRIESQIKTLANGINSVLRQAQDKLSGSQTEMQKQISQDYKELIQANKNMASVVSQTVAAVSDNIASLVNSTVGITGAGAESAAVSIENTATIVLKQALPDAAVDAVKTVRATMLALNNIYSESQDQVKESIARVQKQTDLEAAKLIAQAYTQTSGLIDAVAAQVQSTAAAVSANIQKTYDDTRGAAVGVQSTIASAFDGVVQTYTNTQDATTQTVSNVLASIGSTAENLNKQFNQSRDIVQSGIAKTQGEIAQNIGDSWQTISDVNRNISQNFSESQNQAKEQLAQVNKRLNEKLSQTGESLRVTLISIIKPAEKAKNFADRVAKGASIAFGTFQAYVFDENPTKISNVTIEGIGSDFVKISWETNHVTRNNKVNYGETLAYGQEIWGSDGNKHHKISLNGLKPGKRYFFEVMGQNKNYAYDAFYSFETLKK